MCTKSEFCFPVSHYQFSLGHNFIQRPRFYNLDAQSAVFRARALLYSVFLNEEMFPFSALVCLDGCQASQEWENWLFFASINSLCHVVLCRRLNYCAQIG